jgi:hypothetical protein
MRLGVTVLASLFVVGCSYFKDAPPMKPVKIAPVFSAPAPVVVPCEVTNSCPQAEAEELSFAVLGAELGDDCPRKKSMLAAYAMCRNGRIVAINLSIPAFDAAAKAQVFARALAKYGPADEDRRGGLPMRVKIMMPDWAAAKTQKDLWPYRDKRSAFWWVDEIAKHFLAIEETDIAVEIRVMLADPKARILFDKQQAARDALQEKGAELTQKF